VALRARSLAPLVKTRGIGMTQIPGAKDSVVLCATGPIRLPLADARGRSGQALEGGCPYMSDFVFRKTDFWAKAAPATSECAVIVISE